MHIEKNVCDNILYTLLNEKSKTKDNLNARKDLQDMGIRRDLWPDDNGKYHLALYSLTRDAKKVFLATLKNVRVPDGYSSNISRCIDEAQQKIIGLKSHDCHILIEQLLPLAIRNVLPNQVTSVLIEFCSFFRILCGKSLSRTELDKLQDRIVITLCHLEMLFPPSFFTVMVHLTVHLVEKAKLGGPVHYRYMYPIERKLGHLKFFVRNKAHPEGSIAEGYLAEESLTFCSWYIDDMETRFNRPSRLCYDPPYEMSSVLPKLGTPHGGHSNFNLTKIEKLQAHRYVVYNHEGVKPYINAFRDHIRRTSKGRRLSPAEIEKKVNKDFVDWFQALSVNPDNPYEMSTDIKFLARGPMMNARRFSVYDINGLIHTGEREEHEPYIEASQAQMVYYVDDMVNKGWSIAVHVKPRDMYDIGQGNEDIVYENEPYQEQELEQLFDPNNEYIQLATNLLDSDAIEDNVATNLARDMFE
ncbi:uncharacterized protein LOC130962245 isoform X2 [Arachis stenosperma]|uniref:uncharacterized protein LOC130962245 isoform X2 n=1 Tax=Arachis stenosperma TaxID=217475 RepID=UPI0025AC0C8C|nr:uncharacterized protein LOC130962245 isoform X2 [Arachis stenosperma]